MLVSLQILGSSGLKKRHPAGSPAAPDSAFWLHAQMAMQEIGPLVNGLGGQILVNAPVIEDIDTVGERHRRGNVLLDNQDSLAGLCQISARC